MRWAPAVVVLVTGCAAHGSPRQGARGDHGTSGIPPNDPRFQGERVVEVSRSGARLRQWPVPVDSWPLGLRGPTLILRYVPDSTKVLAVETDGAYVLADRPDAGELEPVDCPTDTVFSGSDYAQCRVVRPAMWILMLEGPCT